MAVDPAKTAVRGEWYWGADCPKCGARTPILHDPMRGMGNINIKGDTPGAAKMATGCPNGHKFEVPVEKMVRFEYKG